MNPPADDPNRTEHLTSLDGAKERLHLFKANLLEEGSFDAVIDGCEGVFHTASPFYHGVKDPQVTHFPDKYGFDGYFYKLALWNFIVSLGVAFLCFSQNSVLSVIYAEIIVQIIMALLGPNLGGRSFLILSQKNVNFLHLKLIQI